MEPDVAINYRGWDRRIAVLDLVSDSGNDRHIRLGEKAAHTASRIALVLAQ